MYIIGISCGYRLLDSNRFAKLRIYGTHIWLCAKTLSQSVCILQLLLQMHFVQQQNRVSKS